MGQIFLSGGGNANKTKKLDEIFLKGITKSGRMLYIPVAMPREAFSYGECFEWICAVFPKLGYLHIDMWTDLKNRSSKELNKYSAIYIGGGNTFSLLNDIRKNGFDKQLALYLKKGGVVYGGSAGAIIFGKSIKTAGFGGDADKNNVGLRNFKGMNLVKGLSVQCHYTKNDDLEMFRFVKEFRSNVLALPDETGIYSKNGKWKVVGDKSAYLFTSDHKIELKHGSELFD
ncbi:MAG: Type 1 glutamine amidotransferase-like domain-containing protein [Ignavibacteria bacterium]|nr:Type 1 glutamine amidotransferase-like domain-containing protein [Ignavibacteria bacterium]